MKKLSQYAIDNGVFCPVCKCWWSMALKREGQKCGDLSYADDPSMAEPCKGILRKATQEEAACTPTP